MGGKHVLAFDARRGTGVREHFFHFMWGYLLPAAHEILRLRARSASEVREDEFVFVSCGPVMDAKTAEMARLLGVEYSIVDDESQTREPPARTVFVRRWDSFLCDYASYARLRPTAAALRFLRQAASRRSCGRDGH